MKHRMYDWIAPGEFSFCPRYGNPESCVIGPDPHRKTRWFRGRHIYWLRIALSRTRRWLGYPPKFWLHPGSPLRMTPTDLTKCESAN